MEDFFQNILQINKTIVPKIVAKSIVEFFPHAINIEWFQNGEIFEAVFHEDDIEKIVFISTKGDILETKVNLPLSLIPSDISKEAFMHGEIMNAIKIIADVSITYEIIVRDLNLNRFLIEFDKKGLIYNKKLL
jgi:hypothetical protein